jgi:hypothetical protein
VKTFDELCQARDKLIDGLLRSPPSEDFADRMVRYLVFGKCQDEMPLKMVAAQEAVLAALVQPNSS